MTSKYPRNKSLKDIRNIFKLLNRKFPRDILFLEEIIYECIYILNEFKICLI